MVGRTGAGKSSLFQILFRFRDICKGQVLLDNFPLDKIDREELRNQLNVVLQQPFVIATNTVRENLDPSGEVPDQILKEALV